MYIGNMVQGKQTQINYKLKKPVNNKKEDWIIVPNTHEPIVDKEKFYANEHTKIGLIKKYQCEFNKRQIKSSNRKRAKDY